MPRIEEIFRPHTARGAGLSSHATGDVAYVTNGLKSNGVAGYVRPLTKDKVYNFLGIAVSAFCEATVQIPPFMARGNGGSGLIVLEPRRPMTANQLGYVAAYINTVIRWRFSWYRQASVERIRRLEIPAVPSNGKSAITLGVKDLIPASPPREPLKIVGRVNLKPFLLDALFSMSSGDYHNASELPDGDIPLISCGDANNGIISFVTVPEEKQYSHKATISFNGMNALTTKFHPYTFAAKDDVAVCTPRKPLRNSTLFFIQLMMSRETWRFNHYRKCFMSKLRRQPLSLPSKGGEIDEDLIEAIVGTSPYWGYLNQRFTPSP